MTSGGSRRVVIVGAGFGGLATARALAPRGHRPARRVSQLHDAGQNVDVVLVDRHNYHLFQPLLYQVATAGLEPADIAHAVRGILRRAPGVTFRHGAVDAVDPVARLLSFDDGTTLGYDDLVLAAGSVTATLSVTGVAEHALQLKSLADAVALRSHLLTQFERCDRDPSGLEQGLITVVVVGAGPTGVELSGALAELFAKVLARDFPRLPMQRARVVLVEVAGAVLAPFATVLQRHALAQLQFRGVEVRLNTAVREVTPTAVHLAGGEVIRAATTVWTAGVRAAPLADVVGAEQVRAGRIRVDADLSVPGLPGVWAIGDIAAALDAQGRILPQLAPVAQQAGRHVAQQILRRAAGLPTEPFRYRDKGTMATIGRRAAVAQLPLGLTFRGTIAWLLWLGLHIITLVGFRNRLSVLLNWAWGYVTWDRAARLITPAVASPASPASPAPPSASAGPGCAPTAEPADSGR